MITLRQSSMNCRLLYSDAEQISELTAEERDGKRGEEITKRHEKTFENDG